MCTLSKATVLLTTTTTTTKSYLSHSAKKMSYLTLPLLFRKQQATKSTFTPLTFNLQCLVATQILFTFLLHLCLKNKVNFLVS